MAQKKKINLRGVIKMMENKIFLENSTNRYICADDIIICSFCSKNITDKPGFYFKSEFFKNECVISIICPDCLNDKKNLRKLKSLTDSEIKFVYKTSIIPLSSILHIPNKPTLITTNSLINAVNLISETKDNTRLAGRPNESWEGVSIGKDITKELQQKDKPIEKIEDGLKYLNMLKDSKPLIEKKEYTKKLT